MLTQRANISNFLVSEYIEKILLYDFPQKIEVDFDHLVPLLNLICRSVQVHFQIFISIDHIYRILTLVV